MGNVVILVLDSVGIGALPDAKDYGDEGAATLPHIFEKVPNASLPNMEKLGLGKITPMKNVSSTIDVEAAYGKLTSKTIGKDTIAGHWEMMGVILDKPFATFEKFPQELMDRFVNETGVGYLGNVKASGTEIIQKLGDEHIKTKKPIVYTSADSVFQIAACESIMPIDELYRICEIARNICDDYNIGRVIARPFIKEGDKFVRTKSRKDFSICPPRKTALNFAFDEGVHTVGIGKIDDIFGGSGIDTKLHSKGDAECLKSTLAQMHQCKDSIIFTNLVDADMLYGHRRDPVGYYKCLLAIDNALPHLEKALGNEGMIIITADHGNDPTYRGTDHTREYAPLLIYSPKLKKDVDLNTGATFANIGKTILDYYKIPNDLPGESFLDQIS